MDASATCLATSYSPWVGVQIDLPVQFLAAAIENPDSVQAALQLGRLDFISALLASLAILIAILSIVGFWNVRTSAVQTAHKAARDELTRELPKLLTQACLDVLKEHPDLIGAALRHDPFILVSVVREAKALFGDVGDLEAGGIADAVGDNDVGGR
jgi:hypothetical protein